VLESLSLIIKESTESAAERNYGHRGRRLEARNHTDQIAEQNEEAERSQEWCVAFAVVADDLVALALDESLNALEDMLQRARTIDRKARTNQQKQNQQERENQNLHRKRVWNRSYRIFHLDMQCQQQRRDGAGKQAIQDFGEPKLLGHK
jgi:hypothetical protein